MFKIGRGNQTNHNEPATMEPVRLGATSPDGAQPLIELRDVVKVYQTAAGDFVALKGIDLQVFPGEFLGIIGKSGAGKSTLLNVVSGADELTSGQVRIDGVSLDAMDENERATWRGRTMGVVHQSFQLLPMLDLVNNVMLPMDFVGSFRATESRQRALELLSMVGIEQHAYKLPSAISGGQQQRVAIARALANDPEIILADEPTGSLDTGTADTVFTTFENLVRDGKTIVMVTHDNSLAPRFSRRVHISDGQIVDQIA